MVWFPAIHVTTIWYMGTCGVAKNALDVWSDINGLLTMSVMSADAITPNSVVSLYGYRAGKGQGAFFIPEDVDMEKYLIYCKAYTRAKEPNYTTDIVG